MTSWSRCTSVFECRKNIKSQRSISIFPRQSLRISFRFQNHVARTFHIWKKRRKRNDEKHKQPGLIMMNFNFFRSPNYWSLMKTPCMSYELLAKQVTSMHAWDIFFKMLHNCANQVGIQRERVIILRWTKSLKKWQTKICRLSLNYWIEAIKSIKKAESICFSFCHHWM